MNWLAIFSFGAMTLWTLTLGATIFGTYWTWKHFRSTPPHLDAPYGLYPVSILKPLKGMDAGLLENLESFFKLEYPRFELRFCVADADDPALSVVHRLMAKHPHVSAHLLIGAANVGINPKINNIYQSYLKSSFDLVLISDSNIRVRPDYLKRQVAHLDADVGMVAGIVYGQNSTSIGGHLETVFLNTFYARGMIIAARMGKPCVLGKSMLFRKSIAKQFGGLDVLGRYLAEDFMAGEAIRRLGLRVVMAVDPVMQPLGKMSVKDFWSRHLRWGRIRKSQAPLPFIFEPLFNSALASGVGTLGVIGLSGFWGYSPSEWVLPFLIFHFTAWAVSDATVAIALGDTITPSRLIAWCVREAISLPLWIHTALGKTVKWRGKQYKLKAGGLLEIPT